MKKLNCIGRIVPLMESMDRKRKDSYYSEQLFNLPARAINYSRARFFPSVLE